MLNKETISTALKLLVITAVSALCLAFVNKVTKPVIAENEAKTVIETQREVFPEADDFEEIKPSNTDLTVNNEVGTKVESVFKAKKDGEDVGYVVISLSTKGYGGDVKIMVGIKDDLTVNKVKITETSETAGLGLKASNPDFIDQFIGRSGGLKVIKNSPPTTEGNDIAAISSATITSKAVTNAVNIALEIAKYESENEGNTLKDEVIATKNAISDETQKQLEEGK